MGMHRLDWPLCVLDSRLAEFSGEQGRHCAPLLCAAGPIWEELRGLADAGLPSAASLSAEAGFLQGAHQHMLAAARTDFGGPADVRPGGIQLR